MAMAMEPTPPDAPVTIAGPLVGLKRCFSNGASGATGGIGRATALGRNNHQIQFTVVDGVNIVAIRTRAAGSAFAYEKFDSMIRRHTLVST
jgi:hypothetical protein